MDRRSFLRSLVGAVGAFALPSLALPDAAEFFSSTSTESLLTPSIITREALKILEQQLVMVASVNREFEQRFDQQFLSIGKVLTIRKPAPYRRRTT